MTNEQALEVAKKCVTFACEWCGKNYRRCKYGSKEQRFQEAVISALEKQISKHIVVEQGITHQCPDCGNANFLTNEDGERNSYCGDCGQKLKCEVEE